MITARAKKAADAGAVYIGCWSAAAQSQALVCV